LIRRCEAHHNLRDVIAMEHRVFFLARLKQSMLMDGRRIR